MDSLRHSWSFLRDALVFGAVTFAFLFHLCAMAADRDRTQERAYARLAHARVFSEAALLESLEHLRPQQLGKCLHPQDGVLIELARGAESQRVRQRSLELLRQKLQRPGLALDACERVLADEIVQEESPQQLPQLEKFLLLYAWVVEVVVLAAFSQIWRSPQAQQDLYQLACRPYLFIPLVGFALLVPLDRFAVLKGGSGYWTVAALTTALLGAGVLYWRLRTRLRPEQLPELSLYLLIASLSIQLVAILAGSGWALSWFHQPALLWAGKGCTLILALFPLFLLEKAWSSRGGQKSTGELEAHGQHPGS